MEKRGKTINITSRFPDFYNSDSVETLFYQFADVFGQMLEQAEIDLLKVMRSHYVDTADNEGSQGFVAAQKGDLDKIFALYLEALGGTSQLMQVNTKFHAGAFKDLNSLAKKLQNSKDSLSKYLYGKFSDKIPNLSDLSSEQELQQALIQELNHSLQDSSLYESNKAQFAEISLTEETRKLLQQKPTGEELQRLNRLLLEAAYPNEIEKSYAPYRERLKGLIQVLRNGAATKQGIIDIVAANLGIVGDDQSAREAKDKIKVEEFLPELVTQTFKIRPFSEDSNKPESLEPPEEFTVQNHNIIPTPPNIVIHLHDNRSRDPDIESGDRTQLPSLQPLINPRLVNLTTQQIIQYEGMLECGGVLRIQADGTVLRNGVPINTNNIKIIPIPSGESRWHFEALIGEIPGKFDQTLFNLSRFDRAEAESKELNPQQASNYAVDIDIELLKETPGSFTVRVPWDIPGFTDKFDELGDHPRNQISGIIDKVKAAGVLSIITYEKRWQETHDLVARLTVERSPFTEEHIAEEANFDISNYQSPYPDGIYHEIVDSLVVSGVFDYTSFDTDNRFA